MEKREVGLPGAVIGAVAKNLGNDVGSLKEFSTIGDDFRALGHVIGIWIAGFATCACFNDYFQSCFGQIGNHGGHKRYPPLPWKSLAGNTNNHEAPLRHSRTTLDSDSDSGWAALYTGPVNKRLHKIKLARAQMRYSAASCL